MSSHFLRPSQLIGELIVLGLLNVASLWLAAQVLHLMFPTPSQLNGEFIALGLLNMLLFYGLRHRFGPPCQ